MKMRGRTILVALALLATLVPVAATAEPPVNPGPFVGTVSDGETNEHHYANAPPGTVCVQIVVTYLVILDYAPVSDTLNVTVGTQTAEGQDGTATLKIERSPCTEFPIEVGGQDVAQEAAYTVEVLRAA